MTTALPMFTFGKGEGENGTIKKQFIELGLQGEEKVEILSGLTEKDLILSSWNNEMYDGAKVRLKSSETASSSDGKTAGETDSSAGAVTSTATETGKEG